MSDDHEVRSAKVQSRATIWSALIGSAGIVLAAWIGVNVGRNQGQDKLEDRNREITVLRDELTTQKAALVKLQDQLQAAQRKVDRPNGSTPISGDNERETPEQAIVRPCPRNDTFQCAAQLPFGVRDDDTFRDAHDTRFYRFELAQPGEIKLKLDPMPNSRFVVVTVHDADYVEVLSKRFDAGKPGTFVVNLRAPGRYYAALDPGSCCSGAPYAYGFVIEK